MNAAFEAGGCVVGILADSLHKALRAPDVRRAVHDGTTVLCTPYSPDAPFSAGNAMGRNKLIYAMSATTLVVASDVEKGGTWSGAVEAIRGKFGRVAVWRGAGEGPGNVRIERLGAIPIASNDELELLIAQPEDHDAIVEAVVAQPSLFDGSRAIAAEGDGGRSPEAEVGGTSPVAADGAALEPPAASALCPPTPTGVCWCGCGVEVSADSFFAKGHASRAITRVIKDAYGGNAQFLVAHGYPKDEAQSEG